MFLRKFALPSRTLLCRFKGRVDTNPLFRYYAISSHAPNNQPDESNIPTFQAFWINAFNKAEDSFELQRCLNNCFGYDLVPPAEVLEVAMRAARRLNDFPTAVRIFGALKMKVEKGEQYQEYLKWLKPAMDELGVCTPEDFGRNDDR